MTKRNLFLFLFITMIFTTPLGENLTRDDNINSVQPNKQLDTHLLNPSPEPLQIKIKGYVTQSPISISGNADFHSQAQTNNWDLGGTQDGSQNAPYILKNMNITDSSVSTLISIQNTDVYFQIRDSYLDGQSSVNVRVGLNFTKVEHGMIHNTTIVNIDTGSSTWGWEKSIYFKYTNFTIISNVTVNAVSMSNGVEFYYANNNSMILSIIKSDDGFATGLQISESSNNTFLYNHMEGSSPGIVNLSSGSFNLFRYNNITTPAMSTVGIGTSTTAPNNTIIENTIITGSSGLSIYSDNNTISRNNITSLSNSYGIYLYNVAHNIISGNNLTAFSTGVYLSNADNNAITGNNLVDSSSNGIILASGSDNNTIAWNNFYTNVEHITDSGTSNNINHNFFDGYSDTDSNFDSIWDTPYSIAGATGNADNYPLEHLHILTTIAFATDLNGNTFADTLQLSWTGGATSYNQMPTYYLYYQKSDNPNWIKVNSGTLDLSYDWNIQDIATGNYRLKLQGISFGRSYLTYSPFFIVAHTPLAVKNLVGSAVDGSYSLSWDTPDVDTTYPVSEYYIFRGVESNNHPMKFITTNTEFNEIPIDISVPYYYIVVAVNGLGEGINSSEIKVEAFQPSPVQQLEGTMNDQKSILTWNPPEDTGGVFIANYTVYRGDTSGSYTSQFTTTNTWYNDTSIDTSKSYYYIVETKNTNGRTSLSSEIMIKDSTLPTLMSDGLDMDKSTSLTGDYVISYLAEDDNGISIVTFQLRNGTSSNNLVFGIENTNSNGSITVNTADFDNGLYKIRFIITDTANNSASFSYDISIDNEITSIIQSGPTILSPNGSELVNGTITIKWEGIVQTGSDTYSFAIYHSADNGSTWNLIVDNLTNTSISWDTTTVSDGVANLIKVVVTLGNGATSEDLSDNVFVILNNPKTGLSGAQIAFLIAAVGVIAAIPIIIRIRRARRTV